MSKEKTLIIGGGQAACQTATSLKNKKYDVTGLIRRIFFLIGLFSKMFLPAGPSTWRFECFVKIN